MRITRRDREGRGTYQRAVAVSEHYLDAVRIPVGQSVDREMMFIPELLQNESSVGVRVALPLEKR